MPATLMLLPCMLLLLLTAVAVAVGGTRLPLEVFEITPTTSTADKHKSLEYTVYDAKDISAAATSTVKPAAEQLTVVSISTAAEEKDLAESRRHARQMLQKQQQHRSSNSKHIAERDLRILYQVGVSN